MTNPTTFVASCTYTRANGRPAYGEVIFAAAVDQEANSDTVQVAAPVRATLDQIGAIAQTLVENTGGYWVVPKIDGTTVRRFWIPGDGGDVDLATVAVDLAPGTIGSDLADVGTIDMRAYLENQTLDTCVGEIAPFTAGLGLTAHVPRSVQRTYPAAVLGAGDYFKVFAEPHLTRARTWTADVEGTLTVWNNAATQLLQVAYALSFGQGASGAQIAAMSSFRAVGSDLTISVDTHKLTSAAGGTFNVLLFASVTWA